MAAEIWHYFVKTDESEWFSNGNVVKYYPNGAKIHSGTAYIFSAGSTIGDLLTSAMFSYISTRILTCSIRETAKAKRAVYSEISIFEWS